LLERYADVIDAHGLCPYMRDVGGLGEVIVVLDPALDVELVVGAIRARSARVIHVVFPCAPRDAAHPFERFCNNVATRVNDRGSVHAAFHPAMTGGREDADRRVGLVRRAPDPLLQLVPAGLPPAPRAIADLDGVLADLAELHAARSGFDLPGGAS
jgi:hypothetical protein